jgi:hypothetical protein
MVCKFGFEVCEFAGRTAAFYGAIFQRGDAGGVVTAIFKPTQSFHKPWRCGGLCAQNPNDPTHIWLLSCSARRLHAFGAIDLHLN